MRPRRSSRRWTLTPLCASRARVRCAPSRPGSPTTATASTTKSLSRRTQARSSTRFSTSSIRASAAWALLCTTRTLSAWRTPTRSRARCSSGRWRAPSWLRAHRS
eukprot:Amastigsp_a496_78.p4 type:complete len:105 gc:universal Amastigsp_a496_78:594-908(+)